MRVFFLIACLMLGGSDGAIAQTTPTPGSSPSLSNPAEKPDARGEVPGVTMPAPGQSAVPEVAVDPKATIRPPNVDPRMAVPAPGTPGGNPAVDPK